MGYSYVEYKAPKLLFNEHYIDMETVSFIEPIFTNEDKKEIMGAAFHFKEDSTKFITIECTTEEYNELLNLLFPARKKN